MQEKELKEQIQKSIDLKEHQSYMCQELIGESHSELIRIMKQSDLPAMADLIGKTNKTDKGLLLLSSIIIDLLSNSTLTCDNKNKEYWDMLVNIIFLEKNK